MRTKSAPRPAAAAPAIPDDRERLDRRGAWALLGILGVLVSLNVPELGSQAWPFRPPSVHPTGILAPLVRAAHREWDVGLIRTAAVLAGLLVAVVVPATWHARSWRRDAAVALAVVVVALLLVPAVLLQVGLRQATAPWFHTNDSTYQIELGGKLLLHGHDPYGHDYSHSGLERFYSRNGTVSQETRDRQVALRHFAYFPGTVLTAAAWRVLPRPFDDYRVFVMLTTLASFFAVLLFRAPLAWKLSAGAFVAANPLAVRGAWFGTADAPSLLFLVLAFALVTRSRYLAAGASLGAAILLKQFALVALPFLAAMLVVRGVPRPSLWRAGAALGVVVAAGILPVLAADPRAFWDDTIAYGSGTYRIIGYGLAALLLRAKILHDRFGPYPFGLLALLVWLPATAWLVWSGLRSRALWACAAGFTVSMFLLLFLGRVFQNSYLIWPLTGIVVAAVLAAGEREAPV